MEISLAPTVAAPACARAEVTGWLAHQTHDGELIEVTTLLISELVTNCIRHAQITPNEPLRLSASLRATTLRLEVRDSGTRGTVAQRPPDYDGDASGFGLNLVAQLSSTWGIERDADGTTVWIELRTRADATA